MPRSISLLFLLSASSLVILGECSSKSNFRSYGILGREASAKDESPSHVAEKGDGSGIFDVDFYESLQSEFARELEKDFGDVSDILGDQAGRGHEAGLESILGDGRDDSVSGKEEMYAAYNELHNLAQEYSKPFDAPAVVVVGHQSSGKSALIEALMGFQFNQVGGGTKTRRPIALRMQYNPKCSLPLCYLMGEDGVERQMSLTEIQDYIERENRRLERDPVRSFDSREINIRMEYKYCPNMILIDTPGLIAAPKVPRGRGGAGSAFVQQRALQASSREAERLVIEKMRCQDYIILCVEDTNDWKHGATREVVQKADPDLARTVVVNTKFDTKVPQYGTPSDLEDFVRAAVLERLSPHKLGGPFFTSVPSGRVGRNVGSPDLGNFQFDNDDDFVSACAETEDTDRSVVATRLRRMGKAGEAANNALSARIGLSKLRHFLEQRIDETYRRNVAKILPMLQAEYASTERRLVECESELESLSVERLKAGADAFCDEFCVCLRKAIQGSIVAPATLFGETLAQETSAAGSFHDVQNSPMSVSDRTWDRLLQIEVGHSDHRLYGGAQYHRALREFHLATKCLRLPTVTEDEIANAAGMGTTHDGVNFLHAACVIALEKARVSFDPLLDALSVRVSHVMEKLCPVTEYMLRENHERNKMTSYKFFDEEKKAENGLIGVLGNLNRATDISQNPQFRQLVRKVFEKFVKRCSDTALGKCRDDLISITRFVTWNLDERSSGALRRSLPDQTDLVSIYQVAVQANKRSPLKDEGPATTNENTVAESPLRGALTPNDDRDYHNLLQLVEEAVCSRDANRTTLVVSGLVQHIVSQWRESFGRGVSTKFNCYFMLPFVDDFHKFMRRELQQVYGGEGDNLCEVFDLAAARRALEVQREELSNECIANKRLQDKFATLARVMREKKDIRSGFGTVLDRTRESEH